jgi:uncharacterized protein YbjT (DUF2867 family)
MRVAVVGATGRAGRLTLVALRRHGHEPVAIARAVGIDIVTGEGLDEALAGVDAVIDLSNTPARDADQARDFFGTATANLLAAEQHAGVCHHVVLSIVGVDRVPGNAHYAGKRRQEELALGGPTPATILRATQFHEFALMAVGWTRRDGVALVPPLLIQPLAVADLAEVLVETVVGGGSGEIREVAGPELQDLVDMARRTLAARGETLHLIPSWRGPFSVEMAGEVLLPGPGAQLTTTTFDEWLAGQRASPSGRDRRRSERQ